jgi:hypothetical protein
LASWEYGSYKTTSGPIDSRLGAAFIAIKKELIVSGYGKSIVADSPVFGDAATKRTKEFQEDNALKVDGQVGPTTSKVLFKPRIDAVEKSFLFTKGTLGKLIGLESAYDPVAIGYADPDDHGFVQINLRIHTDVTVAQAFDPAFSITWAAKYINGSLARILTEINLEKAARASYNIGVEYAKRWMEAGYPQSGGFFDGSSIDWYQRATNYINLIDRQVW